MCIRDSQSPNDRSEDFDVVRNSNVFRIAPNGLLEEIGVNTPCIDYSTGEPLLLTQPQSTNKVTYSENFTQWSIDGDSSVTPSATSSPMGVSNATKLIAGSSDDRQAIKLNNSTTGDVVVSVFAKKGEYSTLQFSDSRNPTAFANFDLQNGLLGSSSVMTGKIEYLGNDWYRCSAAYNSISDIISFRISIAQSPTSARLQTFAGNGTDGVYIWGAQVEEQPFVTSYIPTNGSVSSRLSDQIQNAGSTDTIGSEEGVLYFEGAALVEGGSNRGLSISDGTSSNYLLWKYDDTSNRVQFFYRKDNVNIAIITINDIQVLDINSFALAWDDENLYAYVNEVFYESKSISNTFSANALNTISFDYGSGSLRFYGKTKELRVYKSIAQAKIDLPYIN